MKRVTDAENAFGDIMPSATVHICPVRSDDVALKITNFDALTDNNQATLSRTVMVCACPTSTVVTAAYVGVPLSGTVFIQVRAACYCSAGNKIGLGGSYLLLGTAISSGTGVNTIATVMTVVDLHGNTVKGLLTPCGTAQPSMAVGFTDGDLTHRVVGITVVSSANSPTIWSLDITSMPTVAITS